MTQRAPFCTRGARCRPNSSTGDNSIAPCLSTISCTVGHVLDASEGKGKVTGVDVAIASLVLLSRMTSKGEEGANLETSAQDRKLACTQPIACDGFLLLSVSCPRRTASAEKSTFCRKDELSNVPMAQCAITSSTHHDAISGPVALNEFIAKFNSQLRDAWPQMEHSWVRCRAALQVRYYRIDEHFSRIQPLPDIPTSGKLRIPEGRIIIVGGACYFGVSSHIWRGSHGVREVRIDGRPNFV